MKLEERAKVVRAMDLLCRSMNDEELLVAWLMVGVADGDITSETTDEDLEYYCEDDTFGELMYYFLRRMKLANKYGGLYVDGVASRQPVVACVKGL